MPGYSGTPLGKKLGYRAGMRVLIDGMPDKIRHEIERSIGERPEWLRIAEPDPDAAHIFVTDRDDLPGKLSQLMRLLGEGGFIWVSWPKKASKIPTSMTENAIREICLPMGLVDVKVCAVDDIWSGLKLIRRRKK